MRIAIFDYLVTATNPAGSCHLKMLETLCREHEFTVFSVEFENPCPERIQWVRVPALRRPLALLFICYSVLCPLLYWLHRARRHVRFDLLQGIESNFPLAKVCYAHFCHAAYLRDHWHDSGMRGLRRIFRYLDHKLHAIMEPIVYRRADSVVVPSQGLARELSCEYPWVAPRVRVIPNPVDLDAWAKPRSFERAEFRGRAGLRDESFLLAFVALGQFERKGLKLLLNALAALPDDVELLVVGGEKDTIDAYRRRCRAMGLDRVHFAGMQRDVRPFLWAADAFILPSSYEVFPLVCLQAAAAGLPLLASSLHGVEEFLRDGRNGILVERSCDGIRRAIEKIRSMPAERRLALGIEARRAVQRYSIAHFARNWRSFYEDASGSAAARLAESQYAVPRTD